VGGWLWGNDAQAAPRPNACACKGPGYLSSCCSLNSSLPRVCDARLGTAFEESETGPWRDGQLRATVLTN
jgi:hypothetical protein